MIFLQELLIAPIRDFFEAGGDVLYAILFVTILMWTLIIERFWFFYFVLPGRVKEIEQTWNSRSDTFSWYARQVRDAADLGGRRRMPAISAGDQDVDGDPAAARSARHRDRHDRGVRRDGVRRHRQCPSDGRRCVEGHDPDHVRSGGGPFRSLFRVLDGAEGEAGSERRSKTIWRTIEGI